MRLNEMKFFCFYNGGIFVTLDTWNTKANFQRTMEIAYAYKNINLKKKALGIFKKEVRNETL